MICTESNNCTTYSCTHKIAHQEDYNCYHGHCKGILLPCRIYTIQELRKDKITILNERK